MECQPYVDSYRAGYDKPSDKSEPIILTNEAVQQPGLPPAYPGSPTVVVMSQQNPQTYSVTGHIIFSCFVFWCCGWLCGLIAFILAINAQERSNEGDIEGARTRAKSSMVLSIIGVVAGIICMIAIFVLYMQ